MNNADTILKLSNIKKSFPGVRALKNVSLDVKRGEVHALIGENGAGKSTLIKIITGAYVPDSGIITFEEQEYTSLTPHLAISLGIGAVYQEFTLAPTLSVAENIFLGQKVNEGIVRDYKLMCKKAGEIIGRLGVTINPRQLVRNLSVAYKQLIEICKCLAQNSKFLIMDEPTAPLTDEEVDQLFKIIEELKAQGITIIYISHRLDEIFRVSDRVTVMRDGEIITTKNIYEVDKPQLIKYMVGRELSERFPERKESYGDIALEVKDLVGGGVGPVSFKLKKGEILGISGLVGAGRTELAEMIFGAARKDSGEIYVDGQRADIRSPHDAIRHGIGLVCEDRKSKGLLLRKSVGFNISLPIIELLSRLTVVDSGTEKEVINKQINNLDIKTPSAYQLTGNLSGGNQQKVVLGKWLANDSDILILDEPTRGIDVGSKHEIYKLINGLAEEGKAIIVISSEMEEMLGLTDRMIILYEGSYMTTLEKEDYSQELILQYASGETSLIKGYN